MRSGIYCIQLIGIQRTVMQRAFTVYTRFRSCCAVAVAATSRTVFRYHLCIETHSRFLSVSVIAFVKNDMGDKVSNLAVRETSSTRRPPQKLATLTGSGGRRTVRVCRQRQAGRMVETYPGLVASNDVLLWRALPTRHPVDLLLTVQREEDSELVVRDLRTGQRSCELSVATTARRTTDIQRRVES